MSLLGLLRREGPMTATQAAAELGESVPNCSFHLRQLDQYGLAGAPTSRPSGGPPPGSATPCCTSPRPS